jgi:hypothetical protein
MRCQERERPSPATGTATSTLTKTDSTSISPEDTAARIAELERRVTELERKAKKKQARRPARGCITDTNGNIFMPGVGWIPMTPDCTRNRAEVAA